MRTLLILSALLSHFSLFSQSKPAQCPCCTDQHELFDFWIGDWEVSDTSGTIVGYNTITKEQNNCVLKESWKSAKGKFTGTSFNYYDSNTKTWNQLWIDNTGSQLNLQGGLQGKNMVLRSQPFTDKSGKEKQHQITWTPYDDGSVRQHWIVKNLKKGTSNTLFDGLYKRK